MFSRTQDSPIFVTFNESSKTKEAKQPVQTTFKCTSPKQVNAKLMSKTYAKKKEHTLKHKQYFTDLQDIVVSSLRYKTKLIEYIQSKQKKGNRIKHTNLYFCDTILRTRKSLLKEKNISAFADIILRNLTPAHRLTADSCQTDCQQQKETLTHTFVLKQNKINTLANNAGLVRKVEFKHKHTLSHFINVTHWEKCQLNGVNIVFLLFISKQ